MAKDRVSQRTTQRHFRVGDNVIDDNGKSCLVIARPKDPALYDCVVVRYPNQVDGFVVPEDCLRKEPLKPKYPHVKVQLVGRDGNAFAILGRVTKAMRKHGVEKSEIDAFMQEATAGDYNHLLATTMRWIDAS
jgi:hypothetical protein